MPLLPFHLPDVYFVTYIESCDKNNNSHSTSWRNRYIGQDGVIYILKNGNRQFFVWHPVDDDFKPITSLGIISSRDDYYIKKNNLLVTTQNSIYKFRLINKEVNTDDKT